MCRIQKLLSLILVVSLLLSSALTVTAQNRASANDQSAQAKQWVADYLRYYQLESQATPAEVEKLVECRVKIISPTSSLEDRQAAYKDLYVLLFHFANPKLTIPEQTAITAGRAAGQNAHRNVTDPAAQPVASTTTPLGQLGPVEKRGRGSIPMILIAPAGTDWTIYQSFMDRNASRYTMYAVTLPGYGGSPAPPKPATFDLTATPWYDGAERGVLNLIEKNRLSKPVVVGMTSSAALLAVKLALHQPDKVRAVALLDGRISAAWRSTAKPGYLATPEEIPVIVKGQPGGNGMIGDFAPLATFPRATIEARVKALPPAQLALGNARDVERVRAMAIESLVGTDPKASRYSLEQITTDLTGPLQNLRVPLLSIVARHDDNSPGQAGFVAAQWNEMKLRYPSIPLTIVHFENTRSYITEEAPQELDQAIEAFLAGKPIIGKHGRGPLAARPSPRASAMQAVGASEIAITYGRPQVKQREIWGKLVPYNRMWRAGANEATEITFTSDVLIEGQKLRAGTYTFATIPTENEWTLVFNKVLDQWGTFPSYNPEFDALRVKVKPQAAEHEEWLSYSFENLTPNSVQIVIRWEKIKTAFKVELDAPKAAAGQ